MFSYCLFLVLFLSPKFGGIGEKNSQNFTYKSRSQGSEMGRKYGYMIRRSLKGHSNPMHVMHNFGVNGGFSCELNECRVLSNTAKRSKNPNFICCHLKSVQYVTESAISLSILPREPLQELLNKKVSWFKSRREDESLKLQNKAS